MPIRPEYRHLYRGAAWLETRRRILARARNRCEACGKPDRGLIYTYTWQTRDLAFSGGRRYHMVWIRQGRARWRDQDGKRWEGALRGLPRKVRVILTVAHRDGNPGNMDDANLACWCTWCHLHHDAPAHKMARGQRKDARRPLLADEAGA